MKRIIALLLAFVVAFGSFYIEGGEAQAADPNISFEIGDNRNIDTSADTQNYYNIRVYGMPSNYSSNYNMFFDQTFSDTYVTYSGGLTYDNLKINMNIFWASNIFIQLKWANRTEGFPDGSSFTIAKGARIPYTTSSGVAYVAVDAWYTFTFSAPSASGRLTHITLTKSDTAPSTARAYSTTLSHFVGSSYTNGMIQGKHLVLPYQQASGIADATTGIPDGTALVGSAKVGGTDKNITLTKSGNNFLIQNVPTDALYTETNSIVIAKDTVFASADEKYKVTVTNELSLVKGSTGAWAVGQVVNNYSTTLTHYVGSTYIDGMMQGKHLVLSYQATSGIGNSATGIPDGRALVGTAKVGGVEKNIILAKSGNNFLIQNVPTDPLYAGASSIEIAKDTVFKDAESKYNVTITNDFTLVKGSIGEWAVGVVVTNYNTTLNQYVGSGWANNLVAGAHLVLQYETASGIQAGVGEGTQFTGAALLDDTDGTITLVKSGANFLLQNINTAYPSLSKLTISANTVFTSADGKYTVTVTNDLELAKDSSGIWEVYIEPTIFDTDISWYGLTGEGRIIFPYDEESGIGSLIDGTTFKGKIFLNGEEKQVDWIKSGKNLLTTKLADVYSGEVTKIEVVQDTVLTHKTASTHFKIDVKNSLNYINVDGSWTANDGWAEKAYNDVKITFDSYDGRGFYLKAEIIAGPDKGKEIGTEAYGTWKSSSKGKIFINSTDQMIANYSPNVDMLYISGDYKLDEMTTLLIKEGTILIPNENAQNRRYMRIVNTLELEKESVYGRWGLKGVIQTPTTFNDVTLSVKSVKGLRIVFEAEISNSNKKVKELYGNANNTYGSVIVGDPTEGVYTNENATFVVSEGNLILVGIQVGLMDSIEVKAGTILWPTASSKSQVPIRIQNNVKLTRNAEDEWMFGNYNVNMGLGTVVSATPGGAGTSTSPQTGDVQPIMLYAVVLASMTAIGCSICYFEKRRKLKED